MVKFSKPLAQNSAFELNFLILSQILDLKLFKYF